MSLLSMLVIFFLAVLSFVPCCFPFTCIEPITVSRIQKKIYNYDDKNNDNNNNNNNKPSNKVTLWSTKTKRNNNDHDESSYGNNNDKNSFQNTSIPVELTTTTTAAATTTRNAFVFGPPLETKPNYEEIVGPLGKWMDTLFMIIFRLKLSEQVKDGLNDDSNHHYSLTEYGGITELAKRMNHEINSPYEIQTRAQETIRSLFPSWLPFMYKKIISKNFPIFAAQMNAWATRVAGTWLMGECEIISIPDSDIVDDDNNNNNNKGKNQGLLVKRCRFLEESQCISVCVNSCKIPTQNFFMQDMGLPLTMEPNYETFECQFSFGKMPDLEMEQMAISTTPCLLKCPSAGTLRQFHHNDNNNNNNNNNNTDNNITMQSLLSSS